VAAQTRGYGVVTFGFSRPVVGRLPDAVGTSAGFVVIRRDIVVALKPCVEILEN
jgi:hypothetical protein